MRMYEDAITEYLDAIESNSKFQWIKRDYKKSCSNKKILAKMKTAYIPINLVKFPRAINE